jgi:uncharacterized protein (DUF1697 family)
MARRNCADRRPAPRQCHRMSTHLAFLRAVNVGGTGKISMAELRAWLTKLGFTDVRTLLNSGNVVFGGRAAGGDALERRLEREAAEAFGLTVTFFVRSPGEWAEVIRGNPFPSEAKNDPGHLAVVVLKTAPSAAQAKALQSAIVGREVAKIVGRQAYITYPDGMGTSKLTLPVIEKHLSARGTARSWNTVLKMAALASHA